MASYDEIGFDSEEVSNGRTDRYKGKKGQTDRISVIFPTRLKMGKFHYKERQIECIRGICCEKLGPAKARVGTVILQYATDSRGKPSTPFNYTLKEWIFSGTKFADLKALNEEWPLDEHDIKITCVEEGFQQLKYVATKKSPWRLNEALCRQIMGEAEHILDNIRLGSKMSADEIREHLGIEGESLSDEVDPTDDGDFDDMLSGIEGLDD